MSYESDTIATRPVGYCVSMLRNASTSFSRPHEVIVECSAAGIEKPAAFASAWNYIAAFLRLEHAPPAYRFLCQAMAARRAVLLLDGLDEGGAKRTEIEVHVAEVLAQQGHTVLCTSRPAGLDEAQLARFHRLCLSPLTDEQQQQVSGQF